MAQITDQGTIDRYQSLGVWYYGGVGNWQRPGLHRHVSNDFLEEGRAHCKFELSSLPPDCTIMWAHIHYYYDASYGDGTLNAAPNYSKVGQCVLDHIEDRDMGANIESFDCVVYEWGVGLVFGNVIPDDAWHIVVVTDNVQDDLDNARARSCFRIRNNYVIPPPWIWDGDRNTWWAGQVGSANAPWLEVCYIYSSSSSSYSSSSFSSVSTSFSSSSSSFSSSSFSSVSTSFSSSSSSFSSSSYSSSSFSSISGSFSSSSTSSSFSSSSFSSFSSSSSSFSSSSFSSSSYSSISGSLSSSSFSSSSSSSSFSSVSSSDSSLTSSVSAQAGTCGHIGDGYLVWDGDGDCTRAGWTINWVGEFDGSMCSLGPGNWRTRGFMRFDISAIPGGTTITSATLNVYYSNSQGNGVDFAAPVSSRVGHVIIDHIEDWGDIDDSDYQMAAKTSNIGTLVPDDIAPASWRQVDVTTYVQQDLDEHDIPDNFCVKLRQSLELSYASYTNSNYWGFLSCEHGTDPPYLEINWESSSSSSSVSSSSFSSSSSSFSSSSFSSGSSSFSSSSSSFSSSSFSSFSISTSFSSSSASQSSSFSSSSSSESSSVSSFSSSSSVSSSSSSSSVSSSSSSSSPSFSSSSSVSSSSFSSSSASFSSSNSQSISQSSSQSSSS